MESFDDMDTDQRIAHRQRLRRRMAEVQVSQNRINELREIIGKLNADSDRAADDHQRATAPLQSELEEIDRQHVDAIVAGRTSPPKNASRRRELLAAISEANVKLEDAVIANKRAAHQINQQIRTIQNELNGVSALSIGNQIVNHADDADLDHQWLLQSRLRWSKIRGDAAKLKVNNYAISIQQAEQIEGNPALPALQRRLRRWELEAADANQNADDAIRESEQLRARLLASQD